jgi:2-keto-4-pentenoate hydratase
MPTAIHEGARLLFEARLTRQRLPGLAGQALPPTIEDAYRCQDALIERLLAHYGGHVIGYKIACTNELAQRLLHMDGPFHGKLMSSFCSDSPAHLPAGDFFMRVMEAEFAFRMGRDLPARTKPYEREEVAEAVEGVLPGIEIVDSRFTEWTTVGAASLIADNACHGAWVKGAMISGWRGLDLAEQAVRLFVNGAQVQEGSGKAVLGDPLNALQWLANELAAHGAGLKAGQYITTGVTTDIYLAERGDRVMADFGPVGRVELGFD